MKGEMVQGYWMVSEPTNLKVGDNHPTYRVVYVYPNFAEVLTLDWCPTRISEESYHDAKARGVEFIAFLGTKDAPAIGVASLKPPRSSGT